MKRISAIILTLSFSWAYAQENDNLKTHILSEVTVLGNVQDTMQNFCRANSGAAVENILSRMKGVSLIRRGAYGQEPVFRGLSGGQLNITIDGMKMFGACTDKMDPITIYVEPVNLSHLHAVMGPQGTAYGSSVGGSLNMKLAQPALGNKTTGTAGIDFQSAAAALNHSSSVNVGRKSSAYRASFAFRKSNNYREGGGKEVLFSHYQKINFTLAGKWVLGQDTLAANALIDKGKNIGFPALPMDVGRADAGLYSLAYNHVQPWVIFKNIKAKAYHNAVYHVMDDSKRPAVSMPMDMPGRSKTSGVFIETGVHIFRRQKTWLRLDYFKNDILGEMTMYPQGGSPMYMQTAPASSRQDAGIFISQRFLLAERNKFTLSFRGDIINDNLKSGAGADQLKAFYPEKKNFAAKFLSAISFNYKRKISHGFNLEFSSGYGERMPTLNEKFGFYLFNRFDGYDYLGNPFLKSENTWSAEANVNFASAHFEMQLSPFCQSIGNYILGRVIGGSRITEGARGLKSYANFSRAELKGIDMMILAKAKNIQLINTVKYVRGTAEGNGAMPLIPPLKSVTSLRCQFRQFDFQGEWEASAAQNHVSEMAGEQKTPSYSIFNLRSSYTFNSTLKINAGAENIADLRYREHLDWGGIMRPGRNFYINVNYFF